MANTILIKSRQTDGTGPAATNLKVGELAVNTFDGRVYLGTDLSGAASRAAGGAATASTIVGAPVLDQDNLSSDSATSLATQQSIKAYVDSNAGTGDITGVTAGDGLSGGGSSGAVSLALDLNELTAATVAVGSDSIPIIDATDNTSKKESIADLVSGMAGTGISASSGQLSLTSNSTTIAADSGTAHAIALSETLTVSGTANEIETSISNNTLTIGVPTNPTFGNTTVSGLVATGSVTADVEGDLTLDINGGDLFLEDDGTRFGRLRNSGGTSFDIRAEIQDADIVFRGNDGGSTISALTLDMSEGGSALFSNDATLQSDASVLGFGADTDTTLTHVADTGLLLNSSRQLQFGDSGTYIHQSADGVLDLVADTEIEINATTVDINGAVEISGNLTVSGTTTTVDSTVVSIADPLFELGASGSDDNLDRGIVMKYNSSGAKKAFMGFDDSTGKFTMIPDATDSSAVISGTAGTLVMTTFEGALTGNVTGNASGSSGSCTGNAATATALANARTINGTSFDGTGNITLGNDSVTNAMMAASSITATEIEDSAVQIAKLAPLARGSIFHGTGGSSDVEALNAKTSGQILVGDGTDLASVAVSGDITLAANGTTTIGSGTVHHAMLSDDIISGQAALTSGIATTDELMISDAGTVKRMDISVLSAYTAALSETLTNKTISGGAYST